jgi:hypothetical protein
MGRAMPFQPRAALVEAWVIQHRVQLCFIRPRRPVENGFTESSNGRLCDECLNVNWFGSLHHACERRRNGEITTTSTAHTRPWQTALPRRLQRSAAEEKLAIEPLWKTQRVSHLLAAQRGVRIETEVLAGKWVNHRQYRHPTAGRQPLRQ